MLLILGLAVPVPALSQPLPARPVRIIVPFPPGGGADPRGDTPEEFARFIREDQAKWAKLMRDAGIKPD